MYKNTCIYSPSNLPQNCSDISFQKLQSSCLIFFNTSSLFAYLSNSLKMTKRRTNIKDILCQNFKP